MALLQPLQQSSAVPGAAPGVHATQEGPSEDRQEPSVEHREAAGKCRVAIKS